MKTRIFIALFGVFLLTFSSCKKSEDWASGIAGRYTNAAQNDLVITVNKVSNDVVSISIVDNYDNLGFTNVKMNSATTFTLNTISENNGGSCGNVTVGGTGTATNNNISIFTSSKYTDSSCDSDYTYSANK